MAKKSCSEAVSVSKIKVEENGRKAVFVNAAKKEHIVTRIDDCVVTKGPRADYLLSGDGKCALVELKGTDVNHACEQLLASAASDLVKQHLVGAPGFLVVCSRFPRADTIVQRTKQKVAKQFKTGFHVVTGICITTLDEVCKIDGIVR